MTANTLTTIRLPAAMLAEIDVTAAALGVSRSDLIRARLKWAVVSERIAERRLPIAAE